MPEKEKRSMAAVHSVMKKSSETWRDLGEGRDVLGDALVGVVDLGVDLDLVVGLVRVVLARQLGRHPLPPVEREALPLELVQHRERRRYGEAHCVVGSLLEEEHLVLGGEGGVEVAPDVREDDRDARVHQHEQQHQAEVELGALGLLEVRHGEAPEEAQPLLQRDGLGRRHLRLRRILA
eukprot:scaffold85075_cov56-Phaeocystis_antarctica.AAC.1